MKPRRSPHAFGGCPPGRRGPTIVWLATLSWLASTLSSTDAFIPWKTLTTSPRKLAPISVKGPETSNDDDDNLNEKKDDDPVTSTTTRRQFIDQVSKQLKKEEETEAGRRRNVIINAIAFGLLGASGIASTQLYMTMAYTPDGFRRLPTTQFIAALGDPQANSGTGAEQWGLWRNDPGPRGVPLRQYQRDLEQTNFVAPMGWQFNPKDWWIEEHGIIMESPTFPIPPGRYLVTGGRTVTTGLTITGDGHWKLDDNTAKLYDVTHLPCRSARYQPLATALDASPRNAKPSDFPVAPGAAMPNVTGCTKQDYAVVFLVGKATS